MSQSPDQETGRLCLPELQQADEALDAISQRDMADYKKAIRAKVRKALKGTRKFKLNSATEMFLIICKILNNNPDTDWEFVEKEMADPWLPERIRNYPKALLKDNVVSVVRKQLRGFEEKLRVEIRDARSAAGGARTEADSLRRVAAVLAELLHAARARLIDLENAFEKIVSPYCVPALLLFQWSSP